MSVGEEPGALDPAGIIAALERHRVRYVIIGGVAAQLHGSPAPTRGLDVTPERSAPNLARLAAALASVEAQEWVPGFGYPLQLPMDRRRLAADRVLLTQTRYGRVDVVPSPHGVPAGYDELEPRARRVSAYGAELPVAGLDDLVRSHGAASRAKDKLALARLIDLRLSSQERSSASTPAAPGCVAGAAGDLRRCTTPWLLLSVSLSSSTTSARSWPTCAGSSTELWTASCTATRPALGTPSTVRITRRATPRPTLYVSVAVTSPGRTGASGRLVARRRSVRSDGPTGGPGAASDAAPAHIGRGST